VRLVLSFCGGVFVFIVLVEREKEREKVLTNGFFLLVLEQLVTVLIQS
jgi:hypothetical protein